jgi:RimJ/RimL family protein N-acetyltransferase
MIKGKYILLRRALLNERRLIFDMGMKTNILSYSSSCADNLKEFEADYNDGYFDEKKEDVCGGMMICLGEKPIGFISYGRVCSDEEYLQLGIMELDIWMDGDNYCGKGYGTDAIITLSGYLHEEYNVNTFIMVPSLSNQRAIRSYEKAGFVKTKPADRRSILKNIFMTEYLSRLEPDSEILSADSVLMIKTTRPD